MSVGDNPIISPTVTDAPAATTKTNHNGYNVEFFHIYTDEKIGPVHRTSLNYLREARKAWNFQPDLIVLIDNYNPTVHITDSDSVLTYLKRRGMRPDFWAFEGDMIANADKLLESMTSNRLHNSYLRYIEKHGKYPCSLLTATWYLTRLGVFDTSVIRSNKEAVYTPASRLINILPQDYKAVENRALSIIENSTYAAYADRVQDLFYPVTKYRKIELW